MIYCLTFIFCFLLFLVFLFYSVNKFENMFVQFTYMNKYKIYSELLTFFLDRSYDIVYKDQIIAYSSQGLKPGGDELETIKRNFVKLTFELAGENVIDSLTKFYKTRTALINNMLIYFSTRLDSDELVDLVSQHKTKKEEG